MTAQLFVAALGASSYTYAEATWTQGLSDWIGSHTRTFAFFGGVAGDGGVRQSEARASPRPASTSRRSTAPTPRWRPTTTPPLCRRGRTGRATRPRSKSRCRWRRAGSSPSCATGTFFSLAELNAAIAELVAQINNRVTRHLGASRRALFEELERSALKPLPAEPYVFAEWKECRVGLDYHVEIEKHYYSVPHQLLREKVWARITARTVEVFHRGKRVAAHVRSSSNRKHTTVREHMPSSHRRYADWTPERLRRQAGEIGRNTSALVEIILRERTHPEQGFRACVGILRLAKTYGRERLEAACARALEIGARSYSSVNSILKNNLDRQRPASAADGPAIAHDNIRGPTYFH